MRVTRIDKTISGSLISSLNAGLRLRGSGRILRTLILCVLSTFPSLVVHADGDDGTFIERLITIEHAHESLLSDVAGTQDLRSELVKINARFLADRPAAADGEAIVSSLNRAVFDELELQATHDIESVEHLFLSSVLAGKRGYCLGLTALYLSLAELNDIPLYAVATPTHVFLRYDDGVTRVNIETFQRGANLSDEQYVREHSIPEKSIRKGVFLRNLTTDEFLAQIHNNIGVIYSKRGQYELAEAEYREALELHPAFPAARYNLGNDLLQRGEHKQAVKSFNRALRLYPTDVWALNNRGLAHKKQGKLKKARRDFGEALHIQPGFSQARENLAALRAIPQDRDE